MFKYFLDSVVLDQLFLIFISNDPILYTLQLEHVSRRPHLNLLRSMYLNFSCS